MEKNTASEAAITLDGLVNVILSRGGTGHATVGYQTALYALREDVKQRDILLDMKNLTRDCSFNVQSAYVDYLHKVNLGNQYISAYLEALEAGGKLSLKERHELMAELYNLTFEAAE